MTLHPSTSAALNSSTDMILISDTPVTLNSPTRSTLTLYTPAAVNDSIMSAVKDDNSTDKSAIKSVRSTVSEIGIQANDYDIERRSGRLPARQRLIPAKFRDFKNPVWIDEGKGYDEEDSDYDPDPSPINLHSVNKTSTAKRGRPRKGVAEVPKKVTTDEDVKKDGISAFGYIKRVKNGFQCPCCSKIFSQKGNVRLHLWSHTEILPFTCDSEGCEKAFRSSSSLKRHKMEHSGISLFECDVCRKKFSSKVALNEHKTIHTNEKPYKCDTCNKSFRQVSCYKRHLSIHSDKKPFECKECGRKFAQTSYLSSHMRTHTGERPYQCKLCLKAFSHQSDLARHKVIHSGLKPYECHICKAAFTDPSSRKRHVREHEETKHYACTICGENFKRQNQVNMHMVRWHAKESQATQQALQLRLQEVSEFVGEECSVAVVVSENGEVIAGSEDHQKFADFIQNITNGLVAQHVQIDTSQLKDEKAEQAIAGADTNENNTQTVVPLAELLKDVENGCDTFIAIAEVMDDDGDDAKGNNSSYRIIQEGDEQQVYEIQYQQDDAVTMETTESETVADRPAENVTEVTEETRDFVSEPDFASQEYFNWLSVFTEESKTLLMPLTTDMYHRLGKVRKSITDFMLVPSGVLYDKENFRVLMSICQDINAIMSAHLSYVMDSMGT